MTFINLFFNLFTMYNRKYRKLVTKAMFSLSTAMFATLVDNQLMFTLSTIYLIVVCYKLMKMEEKKHASKYRIRHVFYR